MGHTRALGLGGPPARLARGTIQIMVWSCNLHIKDRGVILAYTEASSRKVCNVVSIISQRTCLPPVMTSTAISKD